MRQFISSVTFATAIVSATLMVPAEATEGDSMCLIGKWQVEDEVLNQTSVLPSIAEASWSTDGSLVIDISPAFEVQLVYADYVVNRLRRKGNFDILLEIRYSGTAVGDFGVSADGRSMSLQRYSDIPMSLRQRIGDGDWINAGDEEQSPPHGNAGYDVECDGDELILTQTVDGPFGGDYVGRFVRID